LCQDHPEDVEYREELGTIWNNLGGEYTEAKKSKEALESYEKARDIRQGLVKAHPEVTRYQAYLATLYANLGFLHDQMHQSKEAQANYQQALDLHRRLAREHPEVTEYQAGLASAWNNLGIFQANTGDSRGAITSWEQAREVYASLSNAHPEVTEYLTGLAGTCCNLGILLRDDGKATKSLERFDEAIRRLEEVRGRVPDDAAARTYLVNSHMNRARTLHGLGRHREARVDWDAAVGVDPGPRGPMLRRSQAQALAWAGQYAQAVQVVEQPAALQKLSAPALCDLAWVYALSARAAAGDAARPLPEREQTAERWARQAVDLLRRSHQGGQFRTPRAIQAARESRDLDFLRGRDDFQHWLAQLGK
jgi:tetratricopeptide (TPR) repeat protein